MSQKKNRVKISKSLMLKTILRVLPNKTNLTTAKEINLIVAVTQLALILLMKKPNQ